jgi:hypothetical protein
MIEHPLHMLPASHRVRQAVAQLSHAAILFGGLSLQPHLPVVLALFCWVRSHRVR